jgi:hypothetical protein
MSSEIWLGISPISGFFAKLLWHNDLNLCESTSRVLRLPPGEFPHKGKCTPQAFYKVRMPEPCTG